MATGDHEASLCVPTRDDPWGGTGSGTLVATARATKVDVPTWPGQRP